MLFNKFSKAKNIGLSDLGKYAAINLLNQTIKVKR